MEIHHIAECGRNRRRASSLDDALDEARRLSRENRKDALVLKCAATALIRHGVEAPA